VALVSDDNFNSKSQRTLLYTFRLPLTALQPSRCLDPLELEEIEDSTSLHVSEVAFVVVFMLVGVPGVVVTLCVTVFVYCGTLHRPDRSATLLRVFRGEPRFERMKANEGDLSERV